MESGWSFAKAADRQRTACALMTMSNRRTPRCRYTRRTGTDRRRPACSVRKTVGVCRPVNRRAVSFPPLQLAALAFSIATLSAQSSDLADLERAAAANPSDVQAQRRLAAAYETAGRRLDAVAAWTRVTELAPQAPSGWYALGLAYSAVAQEAIRSFDDRAEDAAWRQLLIADGLLATGHLTDAFAIYRSVEAQLPSMVTIHESVAQHLRAIRPRGVGRARAASGASSPRTRVRTRKALCEFRAGRYRSALDAAVDRSRCRVALLAGACGTRAGARVVRAPRYAPRLAGTARVPRHDRARRGSTSGRGDGADRRTEAGAGESHADLRARDRLLRGTRLRAGAGDRRCRCCAHVRTIRVS